MIKVTTDAWEKEYKLNDKDEAKISILLDIALSYAQDGSHYAIGPDTNSTIIELAKSLSELKPRN